MEVTKAMSLKDLKIEYLMAYQRKDIKQLKLVKRDVMISGESISCILVQEKYADMAASIYMSIKHLEVEKV